MALKTLALIVDENPNTFEQRLRAAAEEYQAANVAIEVQYQATAHGKYGIKFSALLIARGQLA